MIISSDDVRQLLQDEDPDTVLVLIDGRTDVITQREMYSPRYRGAFEVISRDDLVKRVGGTDLSDHDLAKQAAILDATVSQLGA